METYVLPSLKKDYSIKKFCPRTSDASILSSSAKDNPFSEFPCKYCTRQETEHKFIDEGLCFEFKCTKYGGSITEVTFLNHNGISQQNLPNNSLE